MSARRSISSLFVSGGGLDARTSFGLVRASSGDKSLLLKDIQPDLTTMGKLAFASA